MTEKILANRYRLTEQIGMGGMAIVYRAIDLRTGHNVAVKVLRPEYNEDREFISRFLREAEQPYHAAPADHESARGHAGRSH